jgi:hypothetical protein
MGTQSKAIGDCSFAFGNGSQAINMISVAMGNNSLAAGDYSFALGNNAKTAAANSTAIGTFNVGLSNSLFEIGNGGDDLSRSNALTVLNNGFAGFGIDNPSYRIQLPNSDDNSGRALAYEWITYSDSRVKSDQQLLPYGIDIIKQLQPKKYVHHSSDFKDRNLILGKGGYSIGLLAQELYPLIPEAVVKPVDESKSLWGVDYNKLVPVLIKGMQEQQQQIEAQQKEIDELKTLVNSLIVNQTAQVNK